MWPKKWSKSSKPVFFGDGAPFCFFFFMEQKIIIIYASNRESVLHLEKINRFSSALEKSKRNFLSSGLKRRKECSRIKFIFYWFSLFSGFKWAQSGGSWRRWKKLFDWNIYADQLYDIAITVRSLAAAPEKKEVDIF